MNEEFGFVGGYSVNAARRFTGAYLAPGTIAEVIVPDELVNAGYQIRVGGHSWDLGKKNNVNRLFRVSNAFDITDNVVQVANPMGGKIYIEVPVGVDAGIVDVEFRNTIRRPFFANRSFDQTTQSEWNVESVYVALPDDANLDGRVSVFSDALAMVKGLGTTSGGAWAQGDFNGDGNISVFGDAFVLIDQLGQSVVPPAGFLSRTANTESSLTSSAESIAAKPVMIAYLD